jgi:hypothetical protein
MPSASLAQRRNLVTHFIAADFVHPLMDLTEDLNRFANTPAISSDFRCAP